MELPTPIHIVYIPAIFIIGLIAGWTLRGNVKPKDEYEED